MVQLSHPYVTTGKTIAQRRWTFVGQVMSLLLNTLSRVCHSFPCKEQVSFNFVLQSPSAVILEPKKKICRCFHFSPYYLPDAMFLVFRMLTFKPKFSLSSFTLIKRLFTFCHQSSIPCIPEVAFQLVIHPARQFAICTLPVS